MTMTITIILDVNQAKLIRNSLNSLPVSGVAKDRDLIIQELRDLGDVVSQIDQSLAQLGVENGTQ